MNYLPDIFLVINILYLISRKLLIFKIKFKNKNIFSKL